MVAEDVRCGRGLLTAVTACGVPDSQREQVATLTWAGLHGLVSLRINKPSFPWPPIDHLVDGLLGRLLLSAH